MVYDVTVNCQVKRIVIYILWVLSRVKGYVAAEGTYFLSSFDSLLLIKCLKSIVML